jgi:hypothetical protein
MKLSFGSALVGLAVAQASTVQYSAVTGYFLQDEDSTDASTFDYVSNCPCNGFISLHAITPSLIVSPLTYPIDGGELRPDQPHIPHR